MHGCQVRFSSPPTLIPRVVLMLQAATVIAASGALDPRHLIQTVGLVGVIAMVFAECGLLVGFFLPGDSLLFAAGLLVSKDTITIELWELCALISLAAIA